MRTHISVSVDCYPAARSHSSHLEKLLTGRLTDNNVKGNIFFKVFFTRFDQPPCFWWDCCVIGVWHEDKKTEIYHKWLHYTYVWGRAFIVFMLLCSLWTGTRKRDFRPEGHCPVCGLLKAVSIGHHPTQLFVLPTSDWAEICPSCPHM